MTIAAVVALIVALVAWGLRKWTQAFWRDRENP